MRHDFDYGILEVKQHRPWPLPRKPWLMTQTWCDLLFAHWPVDRDQLRRRVPAEFEIEPFGGRYWLGIVPFTMKNVAPRGVPALPWISAFPELNVRTYVRVGDKAGIYFFSLDAARSAAVLAARTLLNLPYFAASMHVERQEGDVVRYGSRRRRMGSPSKAAPRPDAVLQATYAPVGTVFHATPGTLEHFLTERYCLFNVDVRGRPYRLDIHHPPWPLQPASAVFERNTMAAAAGMSLPAGAEPLLHFARRVDMVAWYPTALD